jgi:hypothetical protein
MSVVSIAYRFRPGETMNRIFLIGVSVLCACASSSGSTASAPAAPQSIRVSGGGGGATGTTMNVSTPAVTSSLAMPLADVWHFLPAAWDSLGIPKGIIDAKGYSLATGGIKIRGRLGKTPLSRYLDCGQTQIGPNADSYEVYLSVTTQLAAAGEQTTVSTTVDAAAKPLNFSQEYSRCSTRGELERRIADGVKAQIKR